MSACRATAGSVRLMPDPPIRIGILRIGAGLSASRRAAMRSRPSSSRSNRVFQVPKS